MKRIRFFLLLGVVALGVLGLISCPSPTDSVGGGFTGFTVMGSYARISGTSLAMVMVGLDSAVVDDATVTIGGIALTWTAPDPGSGFPGGYMDIGGITIAAGADVILSVTAGANTAGATLTMPVLPVVTAPIASAYNASADLPVTWTVSTEPNEVVVEIASDDEGGPPPIPWTVSGEDYEETLLGSATTTTIPAGTLLTGLTGITVNVSATNVTTSLGADVVFGEFSASYVGDSAAFNTIP